jgi:hypothetical protein
MGWREALGWNVGTHAGVGGGIKPVGCMREFQTELGDLSDDLKKINRCF